MNKGKFRVVGACDYRVTVGAVENRQNRQTGNGLSLSRTSRP